MFRKKNQSLIFNIQPQKCHTLQEMELKTTKFLGALKRAQALAIVRPPKDGPSGVTRFAHSMFVCFALSIEVVLRPTSPPIKVLVALEMWLVIKKVGS